MWKIVCRHCSWTSGNRTIKEAADVLGKLHCEDHVGHAVVLTRVADEEYARAEAKPNDD